jgi:hypothetical protein
VLLSVGSCRELAGLKYCYTITSDVTEKIKRTPKRISIIRRNDFFSNFTPLLVRRSSSVDRSKSWGRPFVFD